MEKLIIVAFIRFKLIFSLNKDSYTRKVMIKIIYILTVLLFCNTSLNAQTELYVSPTGNDLNLGTAEQPLASLTGARNAIRNKKKDQTTKQSFTVIIAEGTYTMKEPLELTPEDSGSPGFPIIYKAAKGAKPVFSGGKKITGFSVNENGVWEAKIPESTYYKWRFDQLYVNNKRAILARTPNTGFLKVNNVQQYIWEKGVKSIPEKAQQKLSFDKTNFKPLQGIDEDDIKHVRFRAFHKWDFTLRPIDKIDKDSLSIVTSGKGMKPWNPIKKGGRIVFENYAAALDTVGEWFLNDKGTLYYKPLKGETPQNTEVIAPVLENLVTLKGDATNNLFVAHIRFEGISFKQCHYSIPIKGFEPNQAAVKLNSSAIMLEGSRDITFSNCEISQIGQHALWFGKGCRNSVVEQCYFHNLGGGGIYLGDFNALEGVEHTQNIKINNNIIQTGGQEFPASVGIWVGHSSDNIITHNDIGNFYYTGISVGWVWGYKPSLAKRNKIAYNHIHHIGWALLSDMAAIYTLGKSEGTVISNNLVNHIHAYSYGGWGLYTDEGSSDIILENNLVYSTKTGGFQQHYGKNNIVRNNIFAYAKSYQLQCGRAEKHRSFNFVNNIIVFNEGMVMKGAWNKINIHISKNMYWNTNKDAYDFNGNTFDEWQQLGHDKHSIIADPYFMDASNFDFRFKKKKNSEKIKFIPFDYSKAGVYGDAEWIEKSKLPQSIVKDFDKIVEENMKTNSLQKRG
ncbi:right-handed parallel beta-helix repeat-containing protein [Flavivirga aquimarina]|uniref:Right-handed parallel beta-helix repeat-containing protein n=1 Tax=Flavivirga aquimarina TaxID=2027862 RepID=A0ABT8WFI6_9FLAO|nr:right-handed parallel beta-helix repeat-containing protein [Flavivirga aquimarina]MDO5971920.1 right-handed parallel beta-helix repeat-containing protein [Flavivirga aquimarina]